MPQRHGTTKRRLQRRMPKLKKRGKSTCVVRRALGKRYVRNCRVNEGPWRIVITPRAEKELKAVVPANQVRVRAALDGLAAASQQVDRRKLQGRLGEWRLRVGD